MKISNTFLDALLDQRLTQVKSCFTKEKPDLNQLLDWGNTVFEELILKIQNHPRNFKISKTIDGKKVTITDPNEIRKIMGSHPDDEFNDDLEKLKFMIEKGYKVDLRNPNDQTALFTGSVSHVPEIVEILLKEGADPNVRDKWGLTPLHYACRYNEAKVVSQLIEAGADVNEGDEFGFTPLHEAVLNNVKELIPLLMVSGADFKKAIIKDYDKDYTKGMTALDMAKKKGSDEVVKILEAASPIKIKGPIPGKEWTWDKTSSGYEGVHTYEGKLVWFTHKENPHGGGGASEQSFEDFLKNGPHGGTAPKEMVEKVKAFLEGYVEK